MQSLDHCNGKRTSNFPSQTPRPSPQKYRYREEDDLEQNENVIVEGMSLHDLVWQAVIDDSDEFCTQGVLVLHEKPQNLQNFNSVDLGLLLGASKRGI